MAQSTQFLLHHNHIKPAIQGATAVPRPSCTGGDRSCRPLQRAVVAAAAQGGSGSASFHSSTGKAGSAVFSESPSTSGQPGATGKGFWDLSRMQQQLQVLGLAGVTAYGILNTVYYTGAFLFFWFYVAKVPAGQGTAASAKAFAAVMAGVWAGSQVTKAPRAALALALAPVVDRLMGVLQRLLGLKTRRQVFGVFVAACLCVAVTLFGAIVLAWS